VSLSQDPVFDMLKNDFVCGYRDIENERWAGASGKHEPDGQAVDTTNGAGPHNIQIFVLNPDGIVLTCLPGYWHSVDLASELKLAQKLNQVWLDPSLTRQKKDQLFTEMQLAHIQEHSQAEHNRSRLQGFDIQYEAKHRLYNTDVFYNPQMIDPVAKRFPPDAVKTADVIMHERMAQRPFERYDQFDVVAFADYGKPMYDKHEDYRMANGKIAPGSDLKDAPKIGNTPQAHPIKTTMTRESGMVLRQAINQGLRMLLR
jgi:hypothetical protein